MSPNSLSNLAVQDITDEAAAIHSGGFSISGFDVQSGIGNTQNLLNSAGLGTVKQYRFINDGLGNDLSFANNKLDKFGMNGIESGKQYRATFYDGDNFSGVLDTLDFTTASNGNGFRDLKSTALNKTSSVRITRLN